MHKEPILEARFELFTTDVSVLEIRWQRVPDLWYHDTETARTITHSPIEYVVLKQLRWLPLVLLDFNVAVLMVHKL